MGRLILVRHARPVLQHGLPPSEWPLDNGSASDITRLASGFEPLNDPIVVSSTERKAIETAEALGLGPALPSAAFDEVTRPWFDDRSELEEAMARYFAGAPLSGWEPLAEATARFERGVHDLAEGDAVVVTHGTVMSAWLSASGRIADAIAFWSSLRMPDALSMTRA